jgi:hypothetical protein
MCENIQIGETGTCGNICGWKWCSALKIWTFTDMLVSDIIGWTHWPLSQDDIEYLINDWKTACEIHAMKVAGILARWALSFGS